MNKCYLLGRLGADAELKVTPSGKTVLKFSLATSEKYKDREGTLQEKTQWHRCVMWSDRAAKLAQHLTKGTQLLIEGTIEYGSYEKDNVKHYTTDIKVFNVEFAGGNGKRSDDAPAPTRAPAPAADIDDSEIPF